MTQRPNILLVVADCARSDKWLGPGRTFKTPNVDRLAARGVSFPNTITEKACTTPCFASLLSGLYSPRHGVHLVWGYRLRASVPLLTDALRAQGYRTYAEVTGPLLEEMGLARGFDEYRYRAPCDYLDTRWGEEFRARLRGEGFSGPWFILLHLWELHWKRRVPREFDRPEFGRDAYERATSALDAQIGALLDCVDDDTIVAFTGDHGEKTASETYPPGGAVDYARRLLGVSGESGLRTDHVAYWAGPSVLQQLYGVGAPNLRDVRLRERPPAVHGGVWAAFRDRMSIYFFTPFLFVHDLLAINSPLRQTRMLRRRGLLDERVAGAKVGWFRRLFGARRAADLQLRMWMNTYRQHIDEGHMVHVYDFLVRVPLVIAGPGLPRGMTVDRMVRQVDILPTLVDLAGVVANKSSAAPPDGRSLTPLIRGAAWDGQPAFLSVSGIPADLELRGVRTETHKFTCGPHNPELPVELYDLRGDPHERRNIAADHGELCAELRATAESLARDGVAETPLPESYDAQQQATIERRLQELGYLG
ncbi:MAG: sulfatase-like hydrolase/transferase [Phycisphaerae bacterium]